MTEATLAHLKADLRRAEGVKQFPYDDGRGNLTIGIGHNLTANGLDVPTIDGILERDVRKVISEIDSELSWVWTLDEIRQAAIIELCFNLGMEKFQKFRNTINRLQTGLYDRAANILADSLWAHQVDDGVGGKFGRADRICHMIRTGTYI